MRGIWISVFRLLFQNFSRQDYGESNTILMYPKNYSCMHMDSHGQEYLRTGVALRPGTFCIVFMCH